MFKMNEQVLIDNDQVYPNYSQMFTKKWLIKNLLNGKYENIKKKYGLRWCYRHFPSDGTLIKYYIKGMYKHALPSDKYDKDNYIYLVEGSNKAVYLVGETGLKAVG